MADFGFSIAKTRSVKLSDTDMSKYQQLLELVPSFKRCISCGGCTASCSARQFTDFNIRKTHCYFRRGQYDKLEEELQKCMLMISDRRLTPLGQTSVHLPHNMHF